MDKKLIDEVKRKKEFSQLPDSIVVRSLELNNCDLKETRAFLRKYFGVFLTNRVLKGKGSYEELLKAHLSSRKRDYEEFYLSVFEGINDFDSVIDLGAGMNGLSYPYLRLAAGPVKYLAVEAARQEVSHMNKFFEETGFNALAVQEDLFNIEKIVDLLKKQSKNRFVFMFQVVDALENFEKNFSKKLILEVMNNAEFLAISLPTESLGGRKKFEVNRKWLVDFLEETFFIHHDFEMNGERVFVISKN